MCKRERTKEIEKEGGIKRERSVIKLRERARECE